MRFLNVLFDTPISPWELPAFRGAVAAKAGHEYDLFHNHDAETGGYHYRLPLIQYKQDHGYPMLVCLNEGIEEVHHFFAQPDWTLSLNGREAPVRIRRLDVRQFDLALREQPVRYHLRQWIGLRDEHYGIYTRLDGMVARLGYLQLTLHKQIVALLEQLEVGEDTIAGLQVTLQTIQSEKWVSYKNVKMLAFSLEFSANILLPDYIGLGKGCSVGWGVLKKLKSETGKLKQRNGK